MIEFKTCKYFIEPALRDVSAINLQSSRHGGAKRTTRETLVMVEDKSKNGPNQKSLKSGRC